MMFYVNENLSFGSSIQYTPLCYTPLVCAVKSSSDLNKYKTIGIKELKGHTVGLFEKNFSVELDNVRKMLEMEKKI